MRIARWCVIVVSVAVAGGIVGGIVLSRAPLVKPDSSPVSTGPDLVSAADAEQRARQWARDSNLRLEVLGLDARSNSLSALGYDLRTPDRKQQFIVNCLTGNVVFWENFASSRGEEKLRGPNRTMGLLPVSELDQSARAFLARRYPGFASKHMETLDPVDAECKTYYQRLPNRVWLEGSFARCAIDPSSAVVFGYAAGFQDAGSIRADYSVTKASAEQAAIRYARRIGLVVYGGGGLLAKPESVFVWRDLGVWVPADNARHLEWRIEVVADLQRHYTIAEYRAELKRDGYNGRDMYTIKVDADTGRVIGCYDVRYCPTMPSPTTAAPIFSPGAGTYPGGQLVTISCATRGAIIRYTLDGSKPTTASRPFRSPLRIGRSLTLKARCFAPHHRSSPVTTARYVVY